MFGLYLAIFVSFTILKTTTIPDVHESARDVLKAWKVYQYQREEETTVIQDILILSVCTSNPLIFFKADVKLFIVLV